jgi:hypothetical protein
MRQKVLAVVALAVLAAMTLSGCGSSGRSGGGSSDSPVVITITEQNGSIDPHDGHVVQVNKGQPVELRVTSDAEDEIHVHSSPEHEFEVAPGGEHTFKFTIDTPGTVVVESHGLEVVLVKLQVS